MNQLGRYAEILAADEIFAGSVDKIDLPERIPFGFHGNWTAATA